MRLFVKPCASRLPSALLMIESLESRTFLNATLTGAIAPISGSPGSSTVVTLGSHFNDPNVTGTAVEMQTPEGNIPLALTDSRTPKTVANFLQYINTGEYNGVIVHRSIPGFVIQGGGYTTNAVHINQFAPVQGEPGISNTTGTIAMALSSGPNSGTSEWFINLANNNGTGSTPDLDNTSDGGPFTAFGNVIYNGMSVVNAIAALQVVNDTAQTPATMAFSNLPVVNYSGSTTPSSVPPANMVVTNTVVVPALSFQASSDNPSLVSPSVSGGNLTLNFGGGIGTAHITVKATDLGGNVATTTFAVGVGMTQVNVGKGAATKLLRFTEAGGAVAQISLNGPGIASVSLNGSGLSQSTKHGVTTITGAAQGITIATTGTTGASTLTITGRGAVSVGGLATDGSLRAINGTSTVLNGNDTINGAIGSLTLASLSGSTLSASSIGRLVVRGAIDSSTIRVGGNIASISAGSITNSKIYAGVGTLAAGQNLPAALSGFAAPAAITAVKVGRGGFANSDVAAETLGNLSLGTIQTSNNGTAFGVAGHSLRSLTGVAGGKHLRLQKIATETDVTSQAAKEGVAFQDLVVDIF